MNKLSVYVNLFDRTIKSLEMINEDYIVFLLEDYFLSKSIQNDDFYKIVKFMENNKIIFYRLSSVYGCPKNVKRMEVRSDIKYAINLQPAVWNRKEIINILKQINGKTPWDFEYYFARKEYKNKYIHWVVNNTRDLLGYKNRVLRGKWFPQTTKYYKKRGIDIDWKQKGKLSIYQNIKYSIAKYLELSDKIKLYIGDVRDIGSVRNAMHGVDYIFHAAALKQVPSCEFFPIEAVKTNVLGTENVLTAAIECGVKKVVCLSTDKAVYPVNAMGTSKAMMEKVIIAKSRTVDLEKTGIMCTRYGNVMCSRGSVIPLLFTNTE